MIKYKNYIWEYGDNEKKKAIKDYIWDLEYHLQGTDYLLAAYDIHATYLQKNINDNDLLMDFERHFQLSLLKYCWDNRIPFESIENEIIKWDKKIAYNTIKLFDKSNFDYEEYENIFSKLIANCYYANALFFLQKMYFKFKDEYDISYKLIEGIIYRYKNNPFDFVMTNEINDLIDSINSKIKNINKLKRKEQIDNFKLQQKIMNNSKE